MQPTTCTAILTEQMAALWRQADSECGTLFYQHHVILAVDQVLTDGGEIRRRGFIDGDDDEARHREAEARADADRVQLALAAGAIIGIACIAPAYTPGCEVRLVWMSTPPERFDMISSPSISRPPMSSTPPSRTAGRSRVRVKVSVGVGVRKGDGSGEMKRDVKLQEIC